MFNFTSLLDLPMKIKGYAIGALILGAIAVWYVGGLKADIYNKQVEITNVQKELTSKVETISNLQKQISDLEAVIAKQNKEIEMLDVNKSQLEIKIQNAKAENKNIANEFKKFKDEIENRPHADTCEIAFNNIKNTAKSVAEEFNRE